MTEGWRIKTTVLAGGKLELVCPHLEEGQAVDVLISPLLTAPSGISRLHVPELPESRRSAIDILNEAPGQLVFRDAEEIDDYIREERASWDR